MLHEKKSIWEQLHLSNDNAGRHDSIILFDNDEAQ